MQALGSNWKVNQLEIGDSSLYVTSYLNEYGITYTTQTSVLSVILIAIVALGCSAAIIFYTRRQIIKPMKDMTEKLHDMNGVTEGFQIQTSYGSQEFLVLRDTFNRMMRENVDLRLSAYKHHRLFVRPAVSGDPNRGTMEGRRAQKQHSASEGRLSNEEREFLLGGEEF